jgi:hypothetical protein
MPAGHGTYQLAVLAMLCGTILLFLLCPVPQGPYPVVNGPATTLASLRARALLWIGMALVALRLWECRRQPIGFPAGDAPREQHLPLPFDFPEAIAVLRC